MSYFGLSRELDSHQILHPAVPQNAPKVQLHQRFTAITKILLCIVIAILGSNHEVNSRAEIKDNVHVDPAMTQWFKERAWSSERILSVLALHCMSLLVGK